MTDDSEEGEEGHRPSSEDDLFVEFYRTNFARLVVAIAFKGCSDEEAEEAVQEAFTRTYSRWARVGRGANPIGYVYVTATRLANRPLRLNAGRLTQALVRQRPPEPTDPSESAVESVTIQAALQRLSQRQRHCVILSAVLGWSSTEVGSALGIDPGTVRSNVHDARQRLEKVLGFPRG